ncbi:MAG: ROK family protein [Solobacterium sp.]|nr:ROK family protein [Solobacterium sp.]
MKQYLAFDLGGTFIKYALMNENAEILEQGKVPAATDSLEGLLTAMKSVGEQFTGQFEGAAVSMPGRLDTEKGIAFTGGSYRFIRNIPMGKHLEECLGVPATIGNDGKCAANAEAWNGALSDVDNGCVIVLGTGTGGGIMLNKKIWMGTTGGGGELSHLVSDMTGFSTAGNDLAKIIPTIWAGHASANGLIAKYAVRKGQSPAELDGVKLFEAYDAGDADAKAALEEFGRITAAGIYSIQSVLDLQKYAIGGGISARKEVTDVIREKVDEVFNQFPGRPFMIPEVVTCRYRNDANLIGALRFHLDRIG